MKHWITLVTIANANLGDNSLKELRRESALRGKGRGKNRQALPAPPQQLALAATAHTNQSRNKGGKNSGGKQTGGKGNKSGKGVILARQRHRTWNNVSRHSVSALRRRKVRPRTARCTQWQRRQETDHALPSFPSEKSIKVLSIPRSITRTQNLWRGPPLASIHCAGLWQYFWSRGPGIGACPSMPEISMSCSVIGWSEVCIGHVHVHVHLTVRLLHKIAAHVWSERSTEGRDRSPVSEGTA